MQVLQQRMAAMTKTAAAGAPAAAGAAVAALAAPFQPPRHTGTRPRPQDTGDAKPAQYQAAHAMIAMQSGKGGSKGGKQTGKKPRQ